MKTKDYPAPIRCALRESQESEGREDWTTVISPHYPWFDFKPRELWRYRDLILLLVRRDFVAQYKQTVLGPIWYILQPLLTTIMFTVVFGRIAKIPTDGVPDFIFYFAGIVCWNYFANCMTQTSDTFTANAMIFGKVYFPRMVVPVSIVISNVFKFLIQFCLFLFFLGYYRWGGAPIHPNFGVIFLPLLVLQMALLGLGCGIIVSSVTTKYRDLSLILVFGVQLWMYATPVVYPLSQVPERYRAFLAINPMTAVVESFRAVFLGSSSLNAPYIALSWATTLGLLLFGLILFNRIEKTFIDTV